MAATLKENLGDKGTWMRLVYMILFAVIFNVAEVVTWAVVFIQFLFKLFSGSANERLQVFGGRLAAYLREIVVFLTFHSEHKPYPFAPWPGEATEAPAPAAKPARARKPRAKASKKSRAVTKTEEAPKEPPEEAAPGSPETKPED